MKNNSMKRSPRFPTWRRGKETEKTLLALQPASLRPLPFSRAPPPPQEDPSLLPTPSPSYLGQGLHHRVQQCPHAHSHLQQLQNCRTGQCHELVPPGVPPSHSWESQAGLELVGMVHPYPSPLMLDKPLMQRLGENL